MSVNGVTANALMSVASVYVSIFVGARFRSEVEEKICVEHVYQGAMFPVLSMNVRHFFFQTTFERSFEQSSCLSRQSGLHHSRSQVRLLLVKLKILRPKHRR